MDEKFSLNASSGGAPAENVISSNVNNALNNSHDTKCVSLASPLHEVSSTSLEVSSPSSVNMNKTSIDVSQDSANRISLVVENSVSMTPSMISQTLYDNMNQGTIIITDEGIVFPQGSLLVEGTNDSTDHDASLSENINDDPQNDNEFDIKVESIKVENNQNNVPSYTLADESDLQNISFNNNGVAQLHFMPLSSDDIENLNKINHNVLMSLPEEHKVNIDDKNVFITQNSQNESSMQEENKECLESYNDNEHDNSLFIKPEHSGECSNADISNEIKVSQNLELISDNSLHENAMHQVFYVQIDNEGQPHIIPVSSHQPNNVTLNKDNKPKERKIRPAKDIKIKPSKEKTLCSIAPNMLNSLYLNSQASLSSHSTLAYGKPFLKPFHFTSYDGGEYFEVLGRCIHCFRFSRTTSYCRAEKHHRDPKSSVCVECETIGVSTVVCRRKLNHTAPNALPLNIVVNTALQQPNYVRQLCLQNNVPPIFADLHSIVLHHADITFSSTRSTDSQTVPLARKPTDYARGYLYPFSEEKWETWLYGFCQQTNTSYRIRTGKRINKKKDHGLANHNGKVVQYRTLETQLYNCSLGGKPRKRKIKEGIKRRKERGSKLIGCNAVIHTRLLETENGWRTLEITIPKISAHLGSHDPRVMRKSDITDFNKVLLPSEDNHINNIEEIDLANLEEDAGNDISNKKKEIPLLEMKKNTKNIFLLCSTLVEQINNSATLDSVQDLGQSILNKLLKEASSGPTQAKKPRRRKDPCNVTSTSPTNSLNLQQMDVLKDIHHAT